ncbi:MAG: hypothetical protein KatS3mg105_3660 [Gemmatales bacterium]|nr:MAG: hypothetical protein KatS3mg105_3660 [Gemmatales bacterium]
MSDPRLNSIHLDDVRREEFRRAREVVLGTIGEQTASFPQRPVPCEQVPGARTLFDGEDIAFSGPSDYVIRDKDQVYRLKIGLNTIGRLSDNDVVVADPYLSRRHCAIIIHADNRCEIADVASKNGTFVNGRRVSGPTPLSSGDEIRMCNRHFLFLHRDHAEPGASDDKTLLE